MRILIVAKNYLPNMGYIENILYDAYVKRDAVVDVVKKNEKALRKLSDGLKNGMNYNCIYLVGHVSLIGWMILVRYGNRLPICVFVGDNYGYSRYMKKRLFYNIYYDIRRYVGVFITTRRARAVVFTTRDASEIFNNQILIRNDAKYKSITEGLPVNEAIYRYDADVRAKAKRELGANDSFVLGIFTRLAAIKKIEQSLKYILSLSPETKVKIHVLVVGVASENIVRDLKGIFATAHIAATIVGLVDQEVLSSFMNAADVGIWSNVAITIQQALSTGMRVVVPDSSNVAHLMEFDGVYAYSLENAVGRLEEAIMSVDTGRSDRSLIFRSRHSSGSFVQKVESLLT